MTQAYPLHWPPFMPRTEARKPDRFRSSTDKALNNVISSLRGFAKDSGKDVVNVVISSNVTLLVDDPPDPGIAVYFTWDKAPCCIAVDRYTTVAANVQAIHHVIEAERTKLRHGGLNVVRAAFRGYAALPPPSGEQRTWWQVLGFGDQPLLADAEARYKELAKQQHPDKGGDAGAFDALTKAIRAAREHLKT